MKKYIYALIYDDFLSAQNLEEGPDEIAFYIGTTQTPKRREKQHRYESRTGHEDKYQFIRELEKQGKEWGLVVLKIVDEEDNRPWEYWYVIDYIRKGCPLRNMRYGNLNNVSDIILIKLAKDKSINTVDILQEKLTNEPKESGYSSSRKTQKKAILKSLCFLRTETEDSGERRKWNIYNLGDGTEEIKAEYYMKKSEVADLLLPDVQNMFEELMRKIEDK